MTYIRFDHFTTYISASNVDDYLKEYASQGFIPEQKTVRHDPGLRNGFIFFGFEYIEFCWVEDEELFEKAGQEEKVFRTTPRPFGLGMLAEDVNAVHADWIARGYSVPEVWSKAPRDATADTPPAWSFQEIPAELLPGTSCFVLTYHTRSKNYVEHTRIHPNTIYAISGVTFVSTEPEARATCWRDFLAPREQVVQSKYGFDVLIGPHQATWITPETYQSTFEFHWTPVPHPFGELSVLNLLASDLDIAKTRLEQSGRQVFSKNVRGNEELLVAPDPRDGLVFSIRQQPFEIWSQERMAKTGEKLRLVQD